MGFPESLKRVFVRLAPFTIAKTQEQPYSSDVAGKGEQCLPDTLPSTSAMWVIGQLCRPILVRGTAGCVCFSTFGKVKEYTGRRGKLLKMKQCQKLTRNLRVLKSVT